MLTGCVIDVENTPPVASAGDDQNADVDQLIQLDGSASIDEDGDNLTYHWAFIEKPADSNSELSDANSIKPTFVPDLQGEYILALTVNDGQIDSNSDTLVITSGDTNTNPLNTAPIADAGANLNTNAGQAVQLDGSKSTDADDDDLSYSWSVESSPNGGGNNLSGLQTSNPTFTPYTSGTYTLQLVVNDGKVNSAPDTVTVISTTVNSAPVANAGTDQNNIATGELVQLNGSLSDDADGDDLIYLWSFVSKPGGSNSTLINSSAVNPIFTPDVDGDYVLQLTVFDGQSNSDTVKITSTSPTENAAPIANAGPGQSVMTSQTVQLDGSASSDPNSDPLTYSWSFTAQPNESTATLDSTVISNPIFVPDVDGTYTLSLMVNDSELDSVTASTVTITSSTETVSDDFAGSGPLIGYTTNNPDSLPDTERVNGRYRANLVNNGSNITLHFNKFQGRLDAKLVTFPFEYIARNIGIGTQTDSQTPPSSPGNQYVFAGIQVHVPELEIRNSSHIVVGHRGSKRYTVEGKNTVNIDNGRSSVNDEGANAAPNGRADLRVVGNPDRTLTIYWQLPNLPEDDWKLYRGNGNLPGNAPIYGESVYIGLITYAQDNNGVPFVGTADAIEFTAQ